MKIVCCRNIVIVEDDNIIIQVILKGELPCAVLFLYGLKKNQKKEGFDADSG